MGVAVQLGVVVAVQDVGDEQRGEERHLLREEQPDPELARVELVLAVVVVVLDERRAVMVAVIGAVIRAVGVVGGGHDLGSSGFLSGVACAISVALSSAFTAGVAAAGKERCGGAV